MRNIRRNEETEVEKKIVRTRRIKIKYKVGKKESEKDIISMVAFITVTDRKRDREGTYVPLRPCTVLPLRWACSLRDENNGETKEQRKRNRKQERKKLRRDRKKESEKESKKVWKKK